MENFFDKKNQKIIIEIGSGSGENLFFLSKKYPKRKIIGIEPFRNGLANSVDFCLKNKTQNIFLYPHVFQKFAKIFKNYYFDRCYILFPDPWPKKKHLKRRLINFEFLKDLIQRCLRKGSIFFGSDNLDYFQIVKNYALEIKKDVKISVKQYKKTPTILTKYHYRAIKCRNIVNFLKIDKI